MPEAAALQGLTSTEARQRLSKYGPNTVAEDHPHTWLVFLRKFWAPVPWMLEATIALQFALGKPDEAAIIAALLVFNAVLGFVQENRANNALAMLKSRLEIQVRVLRDKAWQKLPAQELVPGDVVHLRMGDLAPADIRLLDGKLLLDQSALTGESLPVEAGAGTAVHAGAIVKRGEASGEVTATGAHTYFGKTAELVRTAKTVSHLETLIVTIVKYLVTLDTILVAALLTYSWLYGIPLTEVLPFALILLVASVPIALPATYTLATALGALELAKNGVLVTRLSAIEEAAAMDVLASDKTGTITQNRLALTALRSYAPHSDNDLLYWAALACDHSTQDPIDLAILDAAQTRVCFPDYRSAWALPRSIRRPNAQKRSTTRTAHELRVLKGAPRVIVGLVGGGLDIGADVESLGADGSRVLAVAIETGGNGLQLAGLVALQDPPREDAKSLIQNLHDLGVRVLMVSGDGPSTARAVAERVGIGERVCSPERPAGSHPARRTGLRRVCPCIAGRQVPFGTGVAAKRTCGRHEWRRRQRCPGTQAGRGRHSRGQCHRCRQGRRQPGADQPRSGRRQGCDRNQQAHQPAHAYLHHEQDHQDAGDRHLPQCRRDADGRVRDHSAADRTAAVHQRFRHDVHRHRSCFLSRANPNAGTFPT